MFGGMKGFLNPSPEQKKENANYLKIALGVSDEEKYALYDLVLYLLSLHSDRVSDDQRIDLEFKAHYDLINGVCSRLDEELHTVPAGDDDDE